jgi:hypothetical protein
VTFIIPMTRLEDRGNALELTGTSCAEDMSAMSEDDLMSIMGRGQKAKEEYWSRIVTEHNDGVRANFEEARDILKGMGADHIELVDAIGKNTPRRAKWSCVQRTAQDPFGMWHFVQGLAVKSRLNVHEEDSDVRRLRVYFVNVDLYGSMDPVSRAWAVQYDYEFPEE